MSIYVVGDELNIRLLGHIVPYQVTAKVVGNVSYEVAEQEGDVDSYYYNLKNVLSEEVYEARRDVTYMMLSITNPRNTPLKINQVVYVSVDLYDPLLTSKSVEKDSYTLTIRIDHDIVSGDDDTIDDVVTQLIADLNAKPSISATARKNGTIEDVETVKADYTALIDQVASKLSIVANVDVESIVALADADFITPLSKLEEYTESLANLFPGGEE